MSQIVCFGEIMLRLNPVGYKKIVQANEFEFSFAGSEANVAVFLASLGKDAKFVTSLPNNDLGERCKMDLKKYDVDVSDIYMKDNSRIGIYFLEKGYSQRRSKVIYDRKHSAISEIRGYEFDWNHIFNEAKWFHISGITPALSAELRNECYKACEIAKDKGLIISLDLNYRSSLWSEDKAQKTIKRILPYVDILIGNEEDAYRCIGLKERFSNENFMEVDTDKYRRINKEIREKYENIKLISFTLRESISANKNNWSAILFDEETEYLSRKYMIDIVDRVGGGDSFAAALIYSLISEYSNEEALEFAVAASCLKHTIEGDFNLLKKEEILCLAKGNTSARICR